MPGDRTILHCDLNGFFASVEALEHPEIGNKPMAVSGNPNNRHGVILAKNEAAKRFDILTGESVVRAKRKCPHLILLEAHHEKYEYYSKKANAIYARFTNRVEPFGIDESWLDVSASGKLFGDGKSIADSIRSAVKSELGLTLSVGVSFNKVFAKLGSDYKKPDATTVFDRSAYENIIRPMDVKNLLFVGRSTAESLYSLGIRSIGALADCPDKLISKRFGAHGMRLLKYARGLDDSPVSYIGDDSEIKSIGNSITFRRDLVGFDDIRAGLSHVAEKVSARMKSENIKCSVLHLTIKGADFSVLTRQCILPTPSNSPRIMIESALKLLESSWNAEKPIRLLGISGSQLTGIDAPTQAELFCEQSRSNQKNEAAEDAFFYVRKKFGIKSIKFGNLIGDDLE